MNKPDIIAEKIIAKQKLNFQNYKSLTRACKLIDIYLEDECLEAENLVKENFMQNYGSSFPIDLKGSEYLKNIFTDRHRIVHEGLTLQILDLDLNLIMLFLQNLAVRLCSKFDKLEFQLIEKMFEEIIYNGQTFKRKNF